MNDKTLSAGLVAICLLILALITRNGDIAWMALPFLMYLFVGILQSPVVENVSLHAKRTLEQTRMHGSVSIVVKLAVQNMSPEAIHVFIEEPVQPGMKITDGELSQWAMLRPGETTELSYTFTAARGNFSWKSIRTLVGDPLGLIQSEILLPDASTVQVRPPIKKFKPIRLRPRHTVHSPGSIPARIGGRGTDFFGVREYHPGDSLRTLDWRLTARHPRKFFTKEFEQEEIAEVGLILDARQKADLRVGEHSLFDYGIGAAGSLAEMFLHQGHRVSLLIFGERMLTAFPGYGKRQLHRIMSCLSKARISTEGSALSRLDFLPIRMFPPHALIIVLSPFTATDRFFFQRLRASGYQALLISPDPIDFVQPTLSQDASTRLAMRAACIERRLRLNNVAQLQVPVVDWRVHQPLFPLVRHALTRSRGQRER